MAVSPTDTKAKVHDVSEAVIRIAIDVCDESGIRLEALLVPVSKGWTVADVIREVQSRVPQHKSCVEELRLKTSQSTVSLRLHPTDCIDGLLREMDELTTSRVDTIYEEPAACCKVSWTPTKKIEACSPSLRLPLKRQVTACSTPENKAQEPPFARRRLLTSFQKVRCENDDNAFDGATSGSGMGGLTGAEVPIRACSEFPRQVAREVDPMQPNETQIMIAPNFKNSRSYGSKQQGADGVKGSVRTSLFLALHKWWKSVYPQIHMFANPQLLCAHRAVPPF
eukprot:TRINITY_DN68098_c0_g1_i1.p1 TRINITY_DN68098_c0_g1~~TRINITY_DN68098_c0_g1_i1.p1  ORF type:complete len:281 (+),score=36.91 TRINITY_DN68098_c0_g1_i1:87-929(+)